MKNADWQKQTDVRLAKIELLLTNHLAHTERYITILCGAFITGAVGLLFNLFK